MRILFHSSAPTCRTGYGIQTKAIVQRLMAAGHFVRVGCKHEFSKWEVQSDGLEVFEATDVYLVNQMLDRENFDFIFTLWDIWILDGKRQFPFQKWIAYVPINTMEMPAPYQRVLRNTYMQIAQSRHGEKIMRESGLEPVYAPHGIDTKVYYPDVEARRDFRADVGWTDENFVIGLVGINYADDTKGIIPLLLAFKEFHKTHPKARLLLCTLANERDVVSQSINYYAVVKVLGLEAIVAWPDQSDYFYTRIRDEDMRQIYNSMDVFCLPSRGESFGLPIIEAQACFPAGTKVYAKDIKQFHKRIYTGELVTIKIGHKIIRTTAEHPFWTDKGWQLSKDLMVGSRLLYNNIEESNYNEKNRSMFSGRIETFDGIEKNKNIERDCDNNGPQLFITSLANPSKTIIENFWGKICREILGFEDGGIGLYSWPDRWRRDCFNSANRIKTKAFRLYRQFIEIINGMAFCENRRPLFSVAGAFKQDRALSVQDVWFNIFAAMASTSPVFIDKTRADEPYHRMDGKPTVSNERRKIYEPPSGNLISNPFIKYEAVDSIEIQRVENIQVYNFTTESGTYFAEGYLVHNCGVPVIVPDKTSGPELVGPGWLIDVDMLDDAIWTPAGVWRYYPRPSRVLAKLCEAYDAWQSDAWPHIKEGSVQNAAQYDWDVIWPKYWRPIIEQLERERNNWRSS